MRVTRESLESIAVDRLAGFLTDVIRLPTKTRILLNDSSYIDVHFSHVLRGRFSFHWERRHLDGRVYRYDNFPDRAARSLRSFPRHFHRGRQAPVVLPLFRARPDLGFSDFLDFVREQLGRSRHVIQCMEE